MREEWRDVDGYEGWYQVSNFGRVRSLDRYTHDKRFWEGRLLRLQETHEGYMRVELNKNGKARKYAVHRLVAHAFIGSCPRGKEVNHINGDRADNRACNLEYVTHAKNIRHTVHVLGNYRHGEHGSGAKLTAQEVIKIRKLRSERRKDGSHRYTYARLSEMFGVALSTISAIALRRTWKHLD